MQRIDTGSVPAKMIYSGFQVAAVLIGWMVSVVLGSIAAGRWMHRVETSDTLELQRLSMKVEFLAAQIADLKVSIGGQYAEVIQQVRADHATLRDILDWKAGLVGWMAEYRKSIDDRLQRVEERAEQARLRE